MVLILKNLLVLISQMLSSCWASSNTFSQSKVQVLAHFTFVLFREFNNIELLNIMVVIHYKCYMVDTNREETLY